MLPRSLVEAASRNDVATLERWFEASASRDVNAKDDHGRTLLLFAARWGATEAISALLRRGARIDESCSYDVTPLHEAAVEGRRDAVALLLEHGAAIDKRSTHGYTPLMDAAIYGRLDILRFLLRHGAAPPGDDASAASMLRHAETIALLDAVRGAGGWRAYCAAPRRRLLGLRALCDAGRAKPPPGGVLERLFFTGRADAGVYRRLAATLCACRSRGAVAPEPRVALPPELFWLVLKFWRCVRDGG